ncbi:alpha/beta hydrolase [Paratissierella segnis]|jgi:acetyl esterase/lipase|uniref:Alpha/beta hydrolase fold domain-containing protein n=1 Tax=Paratissierella segnis TaxID=2763679 RepID=A0A926EPY4_9FIRM|nr:alpha/beta hydrolase [Paratissierella segnis]MBC8587568.1 alpha/beta hydrolase fold domain-containing protein [Paratissierella segnis]
MLYDNTNISSYIKAKEPYASPLYETDFSTLPPALIIVGEFDPLVDEDMAP